MECLDKPGADTFKRWLTSVQAKTASESRIKPKKAVVRCKACNAQITENEFLIPILGEPTTFLPIRREWDSIYSPMPKQKDAPSAARPPKILPGLKAIAGSTATAENATPIWAGIIAAKKSIDSLV